MTPSATPSPEPVTDPFGTAAVRAAVLATWASSPARFREDANAEEHLSLGYGGRLLAELAANAADAAREAGVPGEVVVGMSGRELRVANTGSPLTAAGVAALAALRASAKRDDAGVGHFGVGFTAVRAITDEPAVLSTTGGVRFSAVDTARAARAVGNRALDAEIGRRQGQIPALRLPWLAPAAADLPEGCVTEVRLPLRAGVDADDVADGLTVDVAMDLLWALPELTAVTMPGYRVQRLPATDGGGVTTLRVTAAGGATAAPMRGAPETGDRRFRTVDANGSIPAPLLADRPVEERTRNRWRLAWVLPLNADGDPDPLPHSMIGAPTPTAEPIGMPARLIGTLPVDESRSRIAPGPLADHLIERAADLYADLVLAVPAGDRTALIPPGGFPLGQVDDALRAAVMERLERTAFLVGAGGGLLVPGRACLVAGLSGGAAARVAEAIPGLLAWPGATAVEALRRLRVSVQGVTAVTAALAQVDRPVAFWQVVYDGLAGASLDELADLPVPRRGGGTLIGPRGVLLPTPALGGAGHGSAPIRPPETPEAPGEGLADRLARLVPGLRLAADGADHPLLRRLGAAPADASAILADPALMADIARRLDDLDHADPDPADLDGFAGLVLDLLDAGGTADGDLADVLLTDRDGEPWPAGSLLLPDAPLAAMLSADADLPVVGSRWVDTYGPELLALLGVRATLAVRHYGSPTAAEDDLPDVHLWWDEAGAATGTEGFDAVPDLDLVDERAWPAALRALSERRETRDALRPTGSAASYTAWWLRRHATVDGVPLGRWRTPDALDLTGLYDLFPVPLPSGVAADLGVLTGLDQAVADPADLLARWADPDRTVPPGRVPAVTARLVAALAGCPDLDLPTEVRTVTGSVTDAGRAAVLDVPWLAQVLDPELLVAGGADPALAAEVLDLPIASHAYTFRVDTGGSVASAHTKSRGVRKVAAPGEPVALGSLPAAVRCLDLVGRPDLTEHPVVMVRGLAVADLDAGVEPDGTQPGATQPAWWWMQGDRLLLDDSEPGLVQGIARAVAHLAGCWSDRHRLVAAARGDRVAQAEAGLG